VILEKAQAPAPADGPTRARQQAARILAILAERAKK
jgi:hypothetical protein